MKYFYRDSDECEKYEICNVCPMRKLIQERYKTDSMRIIREKLKLELVDDSSCKTIVQYMIKEDKKELLDAWSEL